MCALLHAVLGDSHQVLDRGTGQAGLELARVLRPDLILLDWNLPDTDALRVLEAVQADPRLAPIPTLCLTARQGVDESVAAFALGAVDFIRTPFDRRELRARIDAFLRRAGVLDADLERTRIGPPSDPAPPAATTTAAQQIALLEGSVFAGKYRVQHLLGTGSTALVFRVEHDQLGPLALKVLRTDRATGVQRQRLLREAQVVRRLRHPGILPLRDFGFEGGDLYLVTDICEQRTLADELQGRGRLSVERAVALTRQILSALAHAYAQGVVHRDLKPENLLFDSDTQRLKIIDFGLAQIEDDPGQGLTKPGTMLGTPLYMSPEQVVGGRTDARSDLYTVAVVLYELLTGGHPHEGASLAALAGAILKEPPAPSPVELTPGLAEVLDRGLAKDPDQRYQTADAFESALADLSFRDTAAPCPPRHGGA